MSDVFGDEEVYSDNLDEVYFDEYDNEGDFVEDNKLIRRALSLTNSRKSKYDILRMSALIDRQNEITKSIAELLYMSNTEAMRILRHYKWDSSRLQDEWFSDPSAVKERVGLIDEVSDTETDHETCDICLESFRKGEMLASNCKHYFCKKCWKGYIRNAIDEGPPCLDLRCPKCYAAVPTALIESQCDSQLLERYQRFSLRSFVDDNKRMSWCTAPDCTYAAEALIEAPGEPLDVLCFCGNAFCFTCKEEAHRPVDCETVRQWLIKNSAESENITWILANTKACPKCKRPIEKNQGCMHMTCSQCRYEFCWLCLESWSKHGEKTGGFYSCNVYKKKIESGNQDPLELERANAKASLERYSHYWQRWAEHDKARKSALKSLEELQSSKLDILEERTATPKSQLKFIVDSWEEIVSCRRILKWTYAAAYYWFDETKKDGRILNSSELDKLASHKEFFEFIQQEAEHSLERITNQVEKRLENFTDVEYECAKIDFRMWAIFREELIGLTDVTRNQFAKLVDFLEKGVEEGLSEFSHGEHSVEDLRSNSITDEALYDNKGVNGSTSKKARNEETGGASHSYSRDIARSQFGNCSIDSDQFYECPHCTFVNEHCKSRCQMCGRRRGSDF